MRIKLTFLFADVFLLGILICKLTFLFAGVFLLGIFVEFVNWVGLYFFF
jgi:hypothetical protein